MPKAYSYIRFSTKGQIEGRSLKRQLESAEAYALKHELTLQGQSFQDLGVSGFKGKNTGQGAFGQFIQAVEDGSIERGSYLLIESFDRMSRQPVEKSLRLLMEIVELGITVVTLMDNQVYKQNEMSMPALMLSLISMSRAHEESAVKSKRVGDAWHKKQDKAASEVMGSTLPAWLTYSDDRKEILISDLKALTVKYIFSLSAEGWGRASIIRRLNEEKIPPIGAKATKWHPSYITKLLKGRAALGEYHPHITNSSGKREPTGQVIKDYYPQLVNEDLWYKSHAAIQGRRVGSTGAIKKGVTRNIFSGFISCECGSSVQFVNKGTSDKGGYYLVCSLARNGAGCKYVGHRYYEVQWVVLIALQNLLTVYIKKPDDNALEMRLEGELSLLQTQVDNLITNIATGGESPSISKAVRANESRIAAIEMELVNLRADKAVEGQPVDLPALTHNINEQSERFKLHQYLKRQIKSIVLHINKTTLDILVKNGDDIHLNYNKADDLWVDSNGKDFRVTHDTRWGSRY